MDSPPDTSAEAVGYSTTDQQVMQIIWNATTIFGAERWDIRQSAAGRPRSSGTGRGMITSSNAICAPGSDAVKKW